MELRVGEVAKLFAVPEKRIYEWIKDKGLPACQISGQYRFNRIELLEWAMARQVHLSGEIFVGQQNGLVPTTGFADALQAGGIHYRVGGVDKESVLRCVVETLPLPEGADRGFLFDVLLAREGLASTGFGDGIAIPHVRNPFALHVSRPIVSLAFLESPVDFGAIDAKPVFALFTLLSTFVRTHLQLLSRLAFALQDAGFKAAVTHRASAEEILKEARRVEAGLAPPAVVANKRG